MRHAEPRPFTELAIPFEGALRNLACGWHGEVPGATARGLAFMVDSSQRVTAGSVDRPLECLSPVRGNSHVRF